ncbi:MAG: Pr6Pr family membrane protein [Ginsengibacter sp.]
MKRSFILIIFLAGWFALIAQFVLMVQNRIAPVSETVVRYFSFFTILSNLIVAIYFTRLLFRQNNHTTFTHKRNENLTAITVYILVVGLVYQVVLRSLWHPQGLQMWVDELLHTLIPVAVLIFWFLYQNADLLKWKSIFSWLSYPLVYLVFILIRGRVSGYYPYPFVDVNQLGIQKVMINSVFLLLFFIFISAILIGLGKLMLSKKQ